MLCPLRVQYAGASYHVMHRGDSREAIFLEDRDRERLLETLGEACQKMAWEVRAYCLMGNHFHLAVETPQPNLVAGMRWFLRDGTILTPAPILVWRGGRSGGSFWANPSAYS
jgi:REP element-mobilizing transposase RayT